MKTFTSIINNKKQTFSFVETDGEIDFLLDNNSDFYLSDMLKFITSMSFDKRKKFLNYLKKYPKQEHIFFDFAFNNIYDWPLDNKKDFQKEIKDNNLNGFNLINSFDYFIYFFLKKEISSKNISVNNFNVDNMDKNLVNKFKNNNINNINCFFYEFNENTKLFEFYINNKFNFFPNILKSIKDNDYIQKNYFDIICDFHYLNNNNNLNYESIKKVLTKHSKFLNENNFVRVAKISLNIKEATELLKNMPEELVFLEKKFLNNSLNNAKIKESKFKI